MEQAISFTEENYLKTIYSLARQDKGKIANLSIAEKLHINPATVTEMLKKLNEKNLIDYNRIDGAALTPQGEALALKVIRKHRLWETFLVNRLSFTWDEVHEIAEQLEHIQSDKLIRQLDKLLGFPKFDPHGDPIPDKNGQLPQSQTFPLVSVEEPGTMVKLVGVANHTTAFLQYLDKIKLSLNDKIEVKEIHEFDHSMGIRIANRTAIMISSEVARNLLVSNQ
ncbi:iron (metal) dependent repressor, DtxR family [Arachidicoccus rhizosphaerae]|uniref:Transcriptional regulator MntR n=1 Tax=Arachidicoccus rhizosphaerae TaxID=551991 RepID=A0A1H4D3F9_9BACT|nr:metal-dependent transcriptional regulator [Arachidicoccus rhizosphaerae]SEA67076.1 iron (metal) dependent repressor, DtxR family [Arachidicoccus rhizosphaerae]